MTQIAKPTIVAVSGAWHQTSIWKLMRPLFEDAGYAFEAMSNPSAGHDPSVDTEDDAAHIRKHLQDLINQGKTVVPIFHSYSGIPGGAAIRDLSLRSRSTAELQGGVLGVVFLASILYNSGTIRRGARLSDWVKMDHPQPGLATAIEPIAHFYDPDVPTSLAEEAASQLLPQSHAAIVTPVPVQGWPDAGYDGRRAYIRCPEDRALEPFVQDILIKGAGGEQKWIIKTLEGSGHSPFLSRPRELFLMVEDLVREFEQP